MKKKEKKRKALSKTEAGIRTFYRITVRDDKTGKIVSDTGEKNSHSLVQHFLQFLYICFADTNNAIEDTGNTSRTVVKPATTANTILKIAAPANNDDYGLMVGSGTTAEAATDYALATLIAHGTGSGQLQYGATSVSDGAVSGANVDQVNTRTFTNGSGATVTVKEIGIYCIGYDGIVYRYFCICRDVLGTVQDVEDGQTATLQYTVRTTV